MTLKMLAVPSMEHRKSDQPNGHTMGMTYARGLIFPFFVDLIQPLSSFLSLQLE